MGSTYGTPSGTLFCVCVYFFSFCLSESTQGFVKGIDLCKESALSRSSRDTPRQVSVGVRVGNMDFTPLGASSPCPPTGVVSKEPAETGLRSRLSEQPKRPGVNRK